jgi:hypothetical protein
MNEYNREQLASLEAVRRHLEALDESQIRSLRASLADYLAFRQAVDDFQAEHFGALCTAACYRSRLSACCTRDGIITFFADVVINALLASAAELDALAQTLRRAGSGFKCVYLGQAGCLWRVKPIVCEMFLCDPAQDQVFENRPDLKQVWEELVERKQRFTWPDRPVLFDDLEAFFMDRGCRTSLMYLHNSPGLLRVKKQAKQRKICPNS